MNISQDGIHIKIPLTFFNRTPRRTIWFSYTFFAFRKSWEYCITIQLRNHLVDIKISLDGNYAYIFCIPFRRIVRVLLIGSINFFYLDLFFDFFFNLFSIITFILWFFWIIFFFLWIRMYFTLINFLIYESFLGWNSRKFSI